MNKGSSQQQPAHTNMSKERKSIDVIKKTNAISNLIFKPLEPSGQGSKAQTYHSISPQNRFNDSLSSQRKEILGDTRNASIDEGQVSSRNQVDSGRSPRNQMATLGNEIYKKTKNPLINHGQALSMSNIATQIPQAIMTATTNHQKNHSRVTATGLTGQGVQSTNLLLGGPNSTQSVSGIAAAPPTIDIGEQIKELGVLDDTVNQMSIDQVILEEAPLPESNEKRRSARGNKERNLLAALKKPSTDNLDSLRVSQEQKTKNVVAATIQQKVKTEAEPINTVQKSNNFAV